MLPFGLQGVLADLYTTLLPLATHFIIQYSKNVYKKHKMYFSVYERK